MAGVDGKLSADGLTGNEVVSSAVIGDNEVVRGDGGSRGVQGSGVTIDDSDIMTGAIFTSPDGAITAPTYSYANETNTGWYLSASNTVTCAVNGSNSIAIKEFRIDANVLLAANAAITSTNITVDPQGAGDSYIQFDINTANEFRIGVDDDDSDKFKISQGTALGINDTLVVTANGEITMPLQPAFLAYLTASATNVTGDGTSYNIVFNGERYDQNADFNTTTGVFTAPVTGKYAFAANPVLLQFGTHNDMQQNIVTSNVTIRSYLIDPQNIKTSGNGLSLTNSCIVDMDANDTAVVNIIVSGSTKTIDVNGGDSSGGTYFSGALIC